MYKKFSGPTHLLSSLHWIEVSDVYVVDCHQYRKCHFIVLVCCQQCVYHFMDGFKVCIGLDPSDFVARFSIISMNCMRGVIRDQRCLVAFTCCSQQCLLVMQKVVIMPPLDTPGSQFAEVFNSLGILMKDTFQPNQNLINKLCRQQQGYFGYADLHVQSPVHCILCQS